ncbi:hypothetical protein [Nocardioides piscis]|uniref:hypothetical protein n=1 Tax=Nocardioides piscis TaxID=2714938 RepID=UPI001C02CCDD|nr:hypothetical protein [Nocardioides piscis]
MATATVPTDRRELETGTFSWVFPQGSTRPATVIPPPLLCGVHDASWSPDHASHLESGDQVIVRTRTPFPPVRAMVWTAPVARSTTRMPEGMGSSRGAAGSHHAYARWPPSGETARPDGPLESLMVPAPIQPGSDSGW